MTATALKIQRVLHRLTMGSALARVELFIAHHDGKDPSRAERLMHRAEARKWRVADVLAKMMSEGR